MDIIIIYFRVQSNRCRKISHICDNSSICINCLGLRNLSIHLQESQEGKKVTWVESRPGRKPESILKQLSSLSASPTVKVTHRTDNAAETEVTFNNPSNNSHLEALSPTVTMKFSPERSSHHKVTPESPEKDEGDKPEMASVKMVYKNISKTLLRTNSETTQFAVLETKYESEINIK